LLIRDTTLKGDAEMDKLIKFLLKLYSEKFFGCVIIKFENGKATHIETNSTQKWQYKDLPIE